MNRHDREDEEDNSITQPLIQSTSIDSINVQDLLGSMCSEANTNTNKQFMNPEIPTISTTAYAVIPLTNVNFINNQINENEVSMNKVDRASILLPEALSQLQVRSATDLKFLNSSQMLGPELPSIANKEIDFIQDNNLLNMQNALLVENNNTMNSVDIISTSVREAEICKCKTECKEGGHSCCMDCPGKDDACGDIKDSEEISLPSDSAPLVYPAYITSLPEVPGNQLLSELEENPVSFSEASCQTDEDFYVLVGEEEEQFSLSSSIQGIPEQNFEGLKWSSNYFDLFINLQRYSVLM
ncbi:uncharacterized protein LOC111637789 [Centruroides sculpturatus]|uniref:uncharacterized protein LOC111637789 n=1 Tax=Centruroides sculpturatus TaxID=218467 RepID=UPI000C6C9F45|nr:uncharacterized protein LOC111637789 [Centruroides sculpturatus]